MIVKNETMPIIPKRIDRDINTTLTVLFIMEITRLKSYRGRYLLLWLLLQNKLNIII